MLDRFKIFGLLLVVFTIKSIDARTNLKFLPKRGCNEGNLTAIETRLARTLFIGEQRRQMPETYPGVVKLCRSSEALLKETESFFFRCFDPTMSNYVKVILYTIKSNMRKYCSKRGSKTVKKYIKLAPCFNKYVFPFDHCIQKAVNQTADLIYLEDDKMKIPHTCCYAADAFKCSVDFMNDVACIRPYMNDLLDLYRNGVSGLIDFLCGDYTPDTDACDNLPPAKPKRRNTKRYLTPLTLGLELLQSFKAYQPLPGEV